MKITVAGHVFDLARKVCESCGRGIHHQRGNRAVRGGWRHNVDRAGLRWYAELKRYSR
jgi:hypothetical protein